MGNLLEDYLSRKKLSVSEIARRSGVSKSYLSMIINGKRRSVRPRVLDKLAKELELSPSELEHLITHEAFRDSPAAEDHQGAVSCRTAYTKAGFAGTIPDGTASQGYFYETLEEAMAAWLDNNHDELARLSEIISGMDEAKVPLKKNYLWWYRSLQSAWQNRFDDSLEALEEARNFKPMSPLERRFKAKIIGDIGSVWVVRGNYPEAYKMLRLSLILWAEGEQAAVIYLNLGTLFRRTNNFPEAIEVYEKTVALGSDPLKLLAYSGLGQVCLDKKDKSSARRYLLQGYALARKLEGDLHKGDIFCNLGKYYKETGKLERALFILKKGINVTNSYGNLRTKLFIMMELADAYLLQEEFGAAEQILDRIEEEQAGNGGDVLLSASCLTMVARNNLRLGHFQQAILFLNKSYLILSRLTPGPELETCCDLLRESFLRLKKPQEAFFYESELKRVRKFLK